MDKLKFIAEQFHMRGIEAYFVGGYVRDKMMGLESEDIDIVLVGVTDKTIVPSIVERVGTITEEHGKKFPNWTVIIDGITYDFALARRETKSGDLHTDFDVDWLGVTLHEDLERRDLTINAIAQHILSSVVIDPFGGIFDMNPHNKPFSNRGVANPTSEKFPQDALRVVRAARFIAKYDLAASGKLISYCIGLIDKINTISKERIGGELMKMFKTAKRPSLFFDFLHSVGWLEFLFPEIHAMLGVPQDPIHHPEGDVYSHTMHSMDASEDWFIRATMLVHDIAKPLTTTINGEPWEEWELKAVKDRGVIKIQALGHEDMGAMMIEDFYGKYVFGDKRLRKKISILVKLHMLRAKAPLSEKTVRNTLRELMNQKLTYLQLYQVIKADLDGRPPLRSPIDLSFQLGLERANKLLISGLMEPIVTGKKLMALGVTKGKELGDIKKKALEIQDRGNLTEENWKAIMKGVGFPSLKNLNLSENA